MRRIEYIITIVLITTSTTVYGVQKPEREYFTYPIQRHYGFYLNTAYDALVPFGIKHITTGSGVDFGAGFIYEYNEKHFLFQTGIGMAFTYNKYKCDTLVEHIIPIKDYNETYTLHTELRRYDRPRFAKIEIPLLLGQTYKQFYYLAGIIFGVKVIDYSLTGGTLKNYRDYDRYIDPLEGVVDDGSRKVALQQRCDMDLNVDIRAAIEVGLHLHSFESTTYRVDMRLGAYLNIGVFLPTVQGTENIFTTNAYNIYNVKSYDFEPLVVRNNQASKVMGDIQVGLKFSILWMNKTKHYYCPSCKNDDFQPVVGRCVACEQQDARNNAPKQVVVSQSNDAIRRQMQYNEEHRR